MTIFQRLLAFSSWVAVIELPALGWRLQGWWGVGIGFVIGLWFWNWAHDWEMRAILKRQREEKSANRLAVSAIRDYAKAHENLRATR